MQTSIILPMIDAAAAAKVLAENVELLMARRGLTVGAVYERANIAARTLTNVRNAKNTSLDTIAALASVFRVTPSQMLADDLPQQLDQPPELGELISAYRKSSHAGREVINSAIRIAEAMATYNLKPSP